MVLKVDSQLTSLVMRRLRASGGGTLAMTARADTARPALPGPQFLHPSRESHQPSGSSKTLYVYAPDPPKKTYRKHPHED